MVAELQAGAPVYSQPSPTLDNWHVQNYSPAYHATQTNNNVIPENTSSDQVTETSELPTRMCDNMYQPGCEEVICDNRDYTLDNVDPCSETQSFPAHHEKLDTVSACSDSYSNSDYTDSVCSADSTKFLLPKKEDIRIEVTEPQSKTEEVVEESTTDNAACYENKEYTDSVTSQSAEPLLNRASSMWSFVKEVDVSVPVIGVIDCPNFISSQRDLSSNSNISFACQKALRYLQDERVASSLLLPGSCKNVSKLAEDGKLPEDHNIVQSGRHTRNLIFLSICNTLVFIACGSLRNLQSSINHEGGVGIISLAVSCFGFMVGSIFSPFFVQNFDPYRCLLASLVPHFMYIAANFYPVMWLMVPVSFIQGISAAVWWNAMSTYVTFLAKGYSEKRNKDYESVLNRFFGIFCLAFQMYMIFGNLIASLVLTYANPIATDLSNFTSLDNSTDVNLTDSSYVISSFLTANSTSPSAFNSSSHISLCGANYCHHYTISSSGPGVSDFAKYLLFGIYIACLMISLLIAVLLLEPLNKRLFSSAVMTCGMVRSQVTSIGRFIVSWKFMLLSPLLLFSAMEQGFATAEITKAFITCPIGVHMVGYAMICMGVSASISAYLSGWISRLVGRTILIGLAVICNLGLLAFMAIWPPTADSLIVIFVLIGFWGFADGIWLAQTNSLMGVLFPDTFEEAFTGLRIMQGLGSTIAFAYAQVFCMASKIYIMSAVCVIGMVCYLISEHFLKKEQRQKTKTVSIATEEI